MKFYLTVGLELLLFANAKATAALIFKIDIAD
jgi:hypothetical protein